MAPGPCTEKLPLLPEREGRDVTLDSPRDRLSVVLVAPDLPTLGGFELQLSTLAAGLSEKGHVVHVVFRGPVLADHRYCRAMCSAGVRVHAPAPWIAAVGTKVDQWRIRMNGIAMVALSPLIGLVAIGDALVRRRSLRRSLRGVRGVVRSIVALVVGFDVLSWRFRRVFERLIEATRPDLVDVQHSMMPIGITCAQQLGVSVVYTEYGAPAFALESVWIGLRPVINQVDMVIGRAEASIEGLVDVCGFNADRSWTIVPNAVLSLPPADGAEVSVDLVGSDPVCIAVVGRLSPEKAIGDAIEATSRLLAAGYVVRLLVAGDGPMMHELQDLAATMCISEHVTFLGAFDDIGDVLRQAHIVAHPTRNDGRSIAVLEAMAWGRPVVGTAVGGVSELVQHGVTGLLVSPGDLEALSAALELLVTDSALRRRMGTAGRRAFEKGDFTASAMVAQTIEVYRSVMERTRQRGRPRGPGT